MIRVLFGLAFLLGALAILWIAAGFVGTDVLALTVTVLIGLVYGIGCFEMLQYRQATAGLDAALRNVPSQLDSLDQWLLKLPVALQNPVRLRIEGERVPLPGPVFTPYLVGLLVMLGLLGTFIGMVVTLNGAVLALESTTELQAMRAGLATPIKGLGLAFGTSVAGVAASAMLGLISTLSRRERIQVTGQLDQCIANEFRDFSLTHHRQETFKALQYQAQALPQVAERLNAMADHMETMTQSMTQAIAAGQTQFQETAGKTFAELAASVEQSLKANLSESGRLAVESIQPVVTETMERLTEQAQQTQETLRSENQAQVRELAAQFAETAQNLAGGLSNHSEQWLQRLGEGDDQRLQQWERTLRGAGDALVESWQQKSQSMLELQQQTQADLNERSAAVADTAERTSASLLSEWSRILERSGDVMQARMESEEQWLARQAERMDQMTSTLKTELGQLRQEEGARAEAAVERLGALESAVASHLTQLGTALEAPMLELIETASQAPKAAAEVLEQLRGEISKNIERDNELLQERQRIMTDLNALLSSLETVSAEQRAAIETLVSASTEKLTEVSERFGQQVETETGKLTEMADNLEASAVDVSSLSEAFGYAVELFSESNDKLIENLNRVETALDKSSVRSDEQLAYYVAQAREIIDLSMMSQKEIIEEMRNKAEAAPEPVAETVEES